MKQRSLWTVWTVCEQVHYVEGLRRKSVHLEIRSRHCTDSGEGVDDLDQEWAQGSSPGGSLNCRAVQISFGEATGIRRR